MEVADTLIVSVVQEGRDNDNEDDEGPVFVEEAEFSILQESLL